MKIQEQSSVRTQDESLSQINVMDIIPYEPTPEVQRIVPVSIKRSIGHEAVKQVTKHNKIWHFIDKIGINSEEQRAKDGMLMNRLRSKRTVRKNGNSVAIPEIIEPTVTDDASEGQLALFEIADLMTLNTTDVLEDTNKEKSRKSSTLRALGRIAMPIKWIDSKISAAAVDVISRLPGAASKEELYERDRLNKEKFADDKNDNMFKRGYYAYRRNKVKIFSYTPVVAMGAIAFERFVMAGVHYDNILEGSAFDGVSNQGVALAIGHTELPRVESTPVLLAGSSVYVAGGAGQGEIPQVVINEMQAKGMDLGVDIEGVHYSSQIGPVVGTERMDVSGAGGANTMYNQSVDDLKAGKPVQYVGYSEGTLVAIDAYDRAVAANGGVAPANLLPPILVAAPYAQGGIFDNPLTGGLVGNVLDGMGIPTDRKLPAGTIIKYYDSDIYANGGNMNTATLLKNALGLAAGNHDIPNDNDPHYSFTDSDGVIHVVYSRDDQFLTLLERSGIKVLDTENANKAFEAFFPIGKDADGNFLKPDVRAGLTYVAVTLDHQIDPSGNTHIVQDFMASLPDEYKELGQRGMDGFNSISETIGKIQSGEMDPLTGFNIIMGQFNSIMDGFHTAFPQSQNSGGSYTNWSSYSASANFSYNGQQLPTELVDMAHQYIQQFQDYAQQAVQNAPQYGNTYTYQGQPEEYTDGYNVTRWIDTEGTTHEKYDAYQPPAPTTFDTPAAQPSMQYAEPTYVEPATPAYVPEVSTPAYTPESIPEPTPVIAAPQIVEKAPVVTEPTYVEPTPAPVIAEQSPVAPPEVYVAPVEAAPVYEAPTPAPEPLPEPAPLPPAPVELPPAAPAPSFPAFEMPKLSDFLKIPNLSNGPSSSFGSGSDSSSLSGSDSSSTPAITSAITE